MYPWDPDIDEISLISARSNIDESGLQHRVKLVPATADGPILLPLYLDPNAMHVPQGPSFL